MTASPPRVIDVLREERDAARAELARIGDAADTYAAALREIRDHPRSPFEDWGAHSFNAALDKVRVIARGALGEEATP